MKVVYLKGLSTNKEELNFIKNKFNDNGIEFINLVDDYSEFFNKSKEEIQKTLAERIHSITWQTEPATLVCHSMGYNFGLLMPSNLCLIKNIVFISPEFIKITKEEKNKIEESTNITTKDPVKMKLSLNKIKNISTFISSTKWVPEEIENFLNGKQGYRKATILYSKGDKFVSREIINKMSEAEFIDSFEIDTNNHNPLLENTNCIDIIVNETNKLGYNIQK